MHQLKLITKLINKHLSSLADIENATPKDLHKLSLDEYIQENKRVQSYLIRKGHQLKNLLTNAVFMSFAILILGCVAKLKHNVDQIESKLKAL